MATSGSVAECNGDSRITVEMVQMYRRRKFLLVFAVVNLVLHAGMGTNPSAICRLWRRMGVVPVPVPLEGREDIVDLREDYYEQAIVLCSTVDMLVGGLAPALDGLFMLGPKGMLTNCFGILTVAYVLWRPMGRQMYNTGLTLSISMAISGAVKVVSLHSLLWISSYFSNNMVVMAFLTGLQEIACSVSALLALIASLGNETVSQCIWFFLFGSSALLAIAASKMLPSDILELDASQLEQVRRVVELDGGEDGTTANGKSITFPDVDRLTAGEHEMDDSIILPSIKICNADSHSHFDPCLNSSPVDLTKSHIASRHSFQSSAPTSFASVSSLSKASVWSSFQERYRDPLEHHFKSPFLHLSFDQQIRTPTYLLISGVYIIQFMVQYKINLIYPIFMLNCEGGERSTIISEWLLMLGILPSLFISTNQSIIRFKYIRWYLCTHTILLINVLLMRQVNLKAQWAGFACFLLVNDPIQCIYFQWASEMFGHKNLPLLTGAPQCLSGLLFIAIFGLNTSDYDRCIPNTLNFIFIISVSSLKVSTSAYFYSWLDLF
eukprot:GHVH01007709.1.p1 GENE.GHVH01007709.1~~GHVH01007709.1.p1  ORF type:complete len:551 (+),score=46.39 GHVH01007709.1:169-1821(+)